METWLEVLRVTTGVLYAWAFGTNLYVFRQGLRFTMGGRNHMAWLYPLCIAWISATAIVFRYFLVSAHTPFSWTDVTGTITAILVSFTGMQAVHRIIELEEEIDADGAS